MKYDYKSVPVPQLIQDNCEKDARGLPVPCIVFKDKDGKYHFKINDSEKSAYCLVRNLCSICGQPMANDNKWLVGGIASAFDPEGYYLDLPVHKECGHYALKVCPYMAVRNYDGKLDLEKLQKELKNVALNNPTIDPDRLPLFVFTRATLIAFHFKGNDAYIKPKLPYQEVEFWDEGEEITNFPDIIIKLMGTKWQKYLDVIKTLPQFTELYNIKNT